MGFYSEFDSRFTSFVDKLPVHLSFTMKEESVLVYLYQDRVQGGEVLSDEKTIHEFTFDKSVPVKENIHRIRDWLVENWFPRIDFVTITSTPLSSEERLALVAKGMPFEQAAMKKRETKSHEVWVVYRVLWKKNSVFVQKKDDPEKQELWRIPLPVSPLLRKLIEGGISAEGMGDLIRGRVERLPVDPYYLAKEGAKS